MGKSNRVEDTNDSSTVSKLSVIKAGYLDDDNGKENHLEWFVKWERRTSLINRGYFIRILAIERIFRSFLSARRDEPVQVINLGAGFDTLFLRILDENRSEFFDCRFVEVDLENVIRRKAAVIRAKMDQRAFGNENWDSEPKNMERIFPNYDLVACDLSNVDALKRHLLIDCNLDRNLPTLIIAECVFNYLPADAVDNLLLTLATEFPLSAFVVYEQIEPFDKFGQTMLKHFESIKSPLLSIHTYPNVESQMERYAKLGFADVRCWTIGQLYYSLLKPEDRRRIANLEMFDEYEMWHAKCAHYVISVASTKSDQRDRILQSLQIPASDLETIRPSCSRSLPSSQHRIDSSNCHFRRLAHRSALINRTIDGKLTRFLFSCGGWGIGDAKSHARLRNPCLLNLDTYDATNCEFFIKNERDIVDPSRLLERCYHTMMPIDDETFFVFGGRRGPGEALDLPVIVRLDQNSTRVELELLSANDPPRIGRWRHAATRIDSVAEKCVIVCGGLASGFVDPLSTCWRFSFRDLVWTQLPDLPVAVHSHSVCFGSDQQFLIVFGGLSIDERVSDVMQIYSFADNGWTTVAIPRVLRRYGSSTFFRDSVLIVVGGATPERGECHDVIIMKIRMTDGTPELEYETFSLPDSSEVMLLNHDAVMDKDTNRVFVLGGGGNCFSFGTCFNDSLLEIDLSVS